MIAFFTDESARLFHRTEDDVCNDRYNGEKKDDRIIDVFHGALDRGQQVDEHFTVLIEKTGIGLDLFYQLKGLHRLFSLPGDSVAVEKKKKIPHSADIPYRPHPGRFQVLEYYEGPEGDGRDKAKQKEAEDNIFRYDVGLAFFHDVKIIPYAGEASFVLNKQGNSL